MQITETSEMLACNNLKNDVREMEIMGPGSLVNLQTVSLSMVWQSSSIQRSHFSQWESAGQVAEACRGMEKTGLWCVASGYLISQRLYFFHCHEAHSDHLITSFMWLKETSWEIGKEFVKKLLLCQGFLSPNGSEQDSSRDKHYLKKDVIHMFLFP